MKSSTSAIAAAAVVLYAASAQAADASDVSFLTAFVGDFKAHPKDYLNFLQTASFPPEVTSLAAQVGTYTDQSYTTLLDDPNVNVSELKDFATELPWYTRIEAEVGTAAKTSAAETSKETSAHSETSGATTTRSTSTAESSTSATSTSTENAGNVAKIAPVGAALGLAVLAMF
ncbi:predicted protein [Scheffersomyces stipitis CBS 6054]|uniref:Uncharacterized protein n=1 Tax=Scheffersomyces stipitis (strain ATCC 58785 / CBS 6054 / NBRC 10063 / NRRL Y-11545) TaxID=322104 RepID=A3M064_PICST|nr:predicted protein [Scheffersomyces stipitis CBS 6054]ABN68462.2 predicted protein [Scheffersomyces stipitis CBS 6054]KAG2731090.1 hypothetical protein G9P44_006239 [Scheffersomyces stipitis]